MFVSVLPELCLKGFLREADSSAVSSRVFHAPQLGQRPSHFGWVYPHAEHVKTILFFATPYHSIF